MKTKELMLAALKAARDIAAKAEAENREFTAEERTQVASHLAEAKKLKAKLSEEEGDEELKKSILSLSEGVELAEGQSGAVKTAERVLANPGRGKSIGEQFVNSPEFKNWLKVIAPNGTISDGAKGLISPAVRVKTLITGLSDTSAGAFVETDYVRIFEALGRRPRTVLDLIPRVPTTSDIIEYVRQTTRTNNAAPVAEATAVSGSSGVKPESGFGLEKVTDTIKTIAHWMPATKRALSDAAQIRALIDQELREGLEEAVEDLAIDGDGIGENFTGILNTTGTLSQAYSATVAGLDPKLETTRKAVTNLLVNGRTRPTAFAFHPADWEEIDLARLVKNPQNEGTGTSGPILHGYPVVQSESVPEGTGLLGNWTKAKIWDREQATIQVSDSHSDFFIRNLVAVLGEERLGFGVLRPSAFVEIDLTA